MTGTDRKITVSNRLFYIEALNYSVIVVVVVVVVEERTIYRAGEDCDANRNTAGQTDNHLTRTFTLLQRHQ